MYGRLHERRKCSTGVFGLDQVRIRCDADLLWAVCATGIVCVAPFCKYPPPPPHKSVKVFEVETLGLDFGVDPGLCGNRKAPAGGRGLISISIIAVSGVSLGQAHLIDCR
jgi:hypothetical protein